MQQPAHGVRIGMGDVTRFRATVDMFSGDWTTGSAEAMHAKPWSST